MWNTEIIAKWDISNFLKDVLVLSNHLNSTKFYCRETVLLYLSLLEYIFTALPPVSTKAVCSILTQSLPVLLSKQA